jgi:hypothetical protein
VFVGIRQMLQQDAMQAGPHTGRLPVAQPAPARHARAADLGGQHFPRDARAKDKDDASQRRPVIDTRPATFGLGWFRWKERLNRRPESTGNKRLDHAKLTHSPRFR